jgi:hypothetical protein
MVAEAVVPLAAPPESTGLQQQSSVGGDRAVD